MKQPTFLIVMNMPDDWIMRAADDADDMPLEEFIRVYDKAAEQAGWRSFAEILRTATDLQRFREWPA